MSKIEIGKVAVQQQNSRGWLVGQFFPDGSSFQDKNVEIYFKTFPVGDTSDKLHTHPQGREYLIVLSGQARVSVDGEVITLSSGDYIAIPNGVPDQIVEVLEEFNIVGVRYPSVPNNKIILEK